jgi:hypothetical protein
MRGKTPEQTCEIFDIENDWTTHGASGRGQEAECLIFSWDH